MNTLLRWARPVLLATTLVLVVMSCGGGGAGGGGGPIADICNCAPSEPVDYRPAQKHVPLPSNQQAQDITVADMLGWPQTPVPANNAPRTGRELQLFHIAHAFLQVAYVFAGDCDISMEISDTADPMAARAIVETPIDAEYCTARQTIQQQLAARGFTLSFQINPVSPPVAVDVVGLAFQDFPHAARGTNLVGTVWELHPAVVTVTP